MILRCSHLLCFFSRETSRDNPQVWDYDDRSKKPMELPPARRHDTGGGMSCVGIFHPRKCMDGSRFSGISGVFLAQYTSIWMFPKIVGFPPKSSILTRFSIVLTIHFGGTPIFGNTHIPHLLSSLGSFRLIKILGGDQTPIKTYRAILRW